MNKIITRLYYPDIPKTYIAAFYKIIASLAFALVNGLVRYISGGAQNAVDAIPFYEIAFLQNLVGTFILLPFAFKKEAFLSFKPKNTPLYAGYIIFAALGLILWYGSLYYLPLAIAVALGFLSPIFTIIGCRIFLKEDLTKIRIIAILLGMLGAFLITRPDRALLGKDFSLGMYVFLPILSAGFWVISKLFSRKLAQNKETPQTMTLFLLLFMTPISLLPAISGFVIPNVTEMLWISIIGGLSIIAHMATARSFTLAEVSFLTPFGFVRLLASGLIGFLAFKELPSGLNVYIGMFIILFSLIFLSWDKKK